VKPADNFLLTPAWSRIIRSVRGSTLGLVLLVVLALLFPTSHSTGAASSEAGAASSAPTASSADPSAVHAQQADADSQRETLERLQATPRPARDPVALASRIAGAPVPWTATEPFVGPLTVGRQDTFYVLDQTDNTYKQRTARLRLVSEQAYWYIQEGENVRDDELATAARQFDQQTVPTVRRVFGSEWSPGIDGDPRITIFLGTAPGVSAYFSSWDEYPRSVYRYSNEREMIHVNLSSTRPGSSSFDGTIAHELQHMVHWYQNPTDDTWLDEGFAELASSLAFPALMPNTGSFQRQPDVQLTTWSQGSQTGVHYQESYLFSRYFAQRFGQAALGQLLSERSRPPESITTYLDRSGHGVTFDQLFTDWIVANLLDDPAVGDGRYSHDGLEHRATIGMALSPDGRPAEQTVQQYGAKYIELRGDGSDAELTFAGATSVRLVGADPTSGQALWWSNRADGLDSSLTRQIDLSGVTSATLRFNLWYETEREFDFFYVLVSPDGGARWQILHGANADDANPTGNAIGPGYSGKSGVSNGQRSDPGWIAETVDLTPFVGGEVLVRFEYVTDQGYNARGVLLDDIEVPEIGLRDDAESDGEWTASGFLRSANVIPQTWTVQLVEYPRGGQARVRALQASASGRVVERLPVLGGQLERAVLVVSGLAPRTLEAAPFQVTLRPVS
jgi:immune inhibitor A